jgi:hypothetical protein
VKSRQPEGKGEIKPISLLSDSLPNQQTTILGSRNDTSSKSLLDAKPSVVSPRGSNLKCSFVVITEDNYDKFCRGIIASTIHDQACAKATTSCSTITYSKKHDKVKVNRIHITLASSNDMNLNQKFLNPSQFSEEVQRTDIDAAQDSLKCYNIKIAASDHPEQVTKEIFLN